MCRTRPLCKTPPPPPPPCLWGSSFHLDVGFGDIALVLTFTNPQPAIPKVFQDSHFIVLTARQLLIILTWGGEKTKSNNCLTGFLRISTFCPTTYILYLCYVITSGYNPDGLKYTTTQHFTTSRYVHFRTSKPLHNGHNGLAKVSFIQRLHVSHNNESVLSTILKNNKPRDGLVTRCV